MFAFTLHSFDTGSSYPSIKHAPGSYISQNIMYRIFLKNLYAFPTLSDVCMAGGRKGEERQNFLPAQEINEDLTSMDEKAEQK